MKTGFKLYFLALLGTLLFSAPFARPQEDNPEGKDHPLLTRMDNFYIGGYEEKEFDQAEFRNAEGDTVTVEGHVYRISYWIKDGYKAPSELQIIRNYENAIKKAGGTVLKEYLNWSEAYLKLARSDGNFWIFVDVSNQGAYYELTIVEEAPMEQEVVADPNALAKDIDRTGHVAVYGIYFDTDSYTIKENSTPTIKAIADMLTANTSLDVFVIGHTDMTGTLEHNMELSTKRAESVMNALIDKYAIEPARLDARGVGPLCPVGTNKTEQGRKLNRRVELVEK
jgi:OOP family OmpA-OmpF porin